MWRLGSREGRYWHCCQEDKPNGAGRIVGLGTEGSQCPAKTLQAVPTPGGSTDHGCPRGICVQSCRGTQEPLLVRSGNRTPQVPPSQAPNRIKLPYWK